MALTLDEFVSVARESRLLKPDLLDSMLGDVQATGSIHDTHALASRLVGEGALTHWQSEKLMGGVSQGFFLGKYKLQRLIASGSMSSVYEAEHMLLRKRFALKVLPKALVDEASFLERFYREARAVVRLDHPNIIRGFDVGQEGDYHYFVMEYLEGSSFQDLIEKSGPVAADLAAGMIRQASLGLQHAHQAGMIHRDIKPANLLLASDGVVKVLDLGLVRSLPQENDGEAGLTRIHDERMLGTVDYLSPEQAIDSHNVDIRSDIYSLGCTFYFLLAGDPPFAKGTLTERLLAHQTRLAIPISVIRPDVPADLGRILSRMLEKRPDQRYQTPAEVAKALDEWLNKPVETISVLESDPPQSKPWFTSTGQATTAGPGEVTSQVSELAASATRIVAQPAPKVAEVAEAAEPVVETASTSTDRVKSLSALVKQPPVLNARGLWEPWNQWAKAIEVIASNSGLRSGPSPGHYLEIFEALTMACREVATDADEATSRIIREVRDISSPWMNLQTLRTILQSEMKHSILVRVRQIDTILRSTREPVLKDTKPRGGVAKFLLVAVAASLIGAAFLYLGPEPSPTDPPGSWISQARVSLKRQVASITEKIASH